MNKLTLIIWTSLLQLASVIGILQVTRFKPENPSGYIIFCLWITVFGLMSYIRGASE